MVTNVVTHSFSCFEDLQLDNTISMAPRMVSFGLIFISFQKKLSLSTVNMGNKVLDV